VDHKRRNNSKQKYWGEAAPTPASPADPQ
ncbi:hypothetical protein ACLBQC_29035, partial [Klebsiella pneumoniae]